MNTWLLDPGWLIFSEDDERDQALLFAERIRALSSYSDIYLGERSFSWLMEAYTDNWPGSNLRFAIPELTQVVQQLLPQVLSRLLVHGSPAFAGSTSPEFIGNDTLRPELLGDVRGAISRNSLGLVSMVPHWAESSQTVAFSDAGELGSLPLLLEIEELALANERRVIVKFLAGHRLRIVGDKYRDEVAFRIRNECGIEMDPNDWIASERNKVPRDLRKKWGSLSRSSDIAICITGRIGHETSGIAQQCGKAIDGKYLEVENANDIPRILLELGQRAVNGL